MSGMVRRMLVVKLMCHVTSDILLKSVTHYIFNLNLRLAEKEFLSIIRHGKLKVSVLFDDCQVHGLNTPASRGGLKQGDVLVSLMTIDISAMMTLLCGPR